MSVRIVVASALGLGMAIGSLEAQSTAGQFQSINYGETLAAYLTTSDETLPDGSFYKAFAFHSQLADTITITLTSIDFDAVLLLADSSGELISPGGSDNNGGGQCNAHLTFVVPVEGDYLLLATSNYPAHVGEFRVSLARGVRPAPSSEPCRGFFETKGTLTVGDTVAGHLGPPEDGKLGPSYYQVWDLSVPQGQTVTIDLESDEFDARLSLYRGFRTPVDANDDGAGKCNARLVLTQGAHPYRVVMTTGKQEETGHYVLSVTDGAKPVVEESQCAP